MTCLNRTYPAWGAALLALFVMGQASPVAAKGNEQTDPVFVVGTGDGGEVTVDGTVNVDTTTPLDVQFKSPPTVNVNGVVPVSDNNGSLTVDDGDGALTVDGTINVDTTTPLDVKIINPPSAASNVTVVNPVEVDQLAYPVYTLVVSLTDTIGMGSSFGNSSEVDTPGDGIWEITGFDVLLDFPATLRRCHYELNYPLDGTGQPGASSVAIFAHDAYDPGTVHYNFDPPILVEDKVALRVVAREGADGNFCSTTSVLRFRSHISR